MGKISFILKELFLFFIRIFFLQLKNGEKCIICGKKSFYYPVCRDCRVSYFSTDEVLKLKRCKLCGKELISTEELCTRCRENPVLRNTDLLLALFPYRLWNKQLMFLWKKRDVRSLSYFFAEIFSKALRVLDCKVIVPVPPRPGKIQENGWDQIDEVCSFLKYIFGFKVFDVLERESVSEQKKLGREQRLENIGTAYKLCKKKKMQKILKKNSGNIPKEVYIIDDVSTTGATLESCATVLKEIGVEKVNAVILFIVN